MIAGLCATAQADDAVPPTHLERELQDRDRIAASAAIGAGGQGAATYSGIDVGLDLAWRGARLGLGARGVWLDGALRTSDWEGWAILRVLRLFEATRDN
ncbi:MAG: hypothetical protein M3680_28135, partial [Myxococcota bacterium]|nr:hypothetical protein [Myxococcota bacterium]